MWSNPPIEVDAMRTMLLASSTWVTLLGGSSPASDAIHYPSAAVGDAATADLPPRIVIEPSSDSDRVIAPGIVLPRGSLQLVLTMADVTGADIEKTARSIKSDLSTQVVGLPIVDVAVGMSSEPDAASRAAQESEDESGGSNAIATRTILIVVTYEIS